MARSYLFLWQCIHACLLSRCSRVRLCVTTKTAAHQATQSLGFSRPEHGSGLPLSSPECIHTQSVYISHLFVPLLPNLLLIPPSAFSCCYYSLWFCLFLLYAFSLFAKLVTVFIHSEPKFFKHL